MRPSDLTHEHMELCRYGIPGPFLRPEDAPPPNVVYRIYDADGVLIYVGRSVSPFTRLTAHERTKLWFYLAASVTLEHFDSERDANVAERDAIANEQPLYNVMHSTVRSVPYSYGPDHRWPRSWRELCEQANRDAETVWLLANFPAPLEKAS